MRAAAVVLAAGGSSRMGVPKHLLRLPCGRTMPRRAADIAWAAGASRVCVVLGAEAERVAATLGGQPSVEVVVNDTWQRGIGSSIALGIAALEHAEIDAAWLLLADQPQVTSDALRQLLQAAEMHGAAAARYADTVGVPACFARRYFPALRALPPASGARGLLQSIVNVATVALPEAAFDVDTPSDAARLQLRS